MTTPRTYKVRCTACKGTGLNQQVGGGRPRVCDVCKGKGYILKTL